MTRKHTHKQIFATHPNTGPSRKFIYVYVFSFPEINSLGTFLGNCLAPTRRKQFAEKVFRWVALEVTRVSANFLFWGGGGRVA